MCAVHARFTGALHAGQVKQYQKRAYGVASTGGCAGTFCLELRPEAISPASMIFDIHIYFSFSFDYTRYISAKNSDLRDDNRIPCLRKLTEELLRESRDIFSCHFRLTESTADASLEKSVM